MTNKTPAPQWVTDVGDFLNTASVIIENLLSAAGTRIPAINANMGLVIFRLIDTLANPIVMGYLASKLAPEDFRVIATVLAGFIGISWSYLNWSISKDLVERAPWTRKMGAGIGLVALVLIGSILLDGVVDASWVFILAGRIDVLMTPGIKAYWIGLKSLPFIFSIMWYMTFIASNVADIWSAIKEYKEKNEPEATPKPDDHHPTEKDQSDEDSSFPEDFHVEYDSNIHRAVPSRDPNRRIVFLKEAKPGDHPEGWCYASEVKATPPTTPPPPAPAATH